MTLRDQSFKRWAWHLLNFIYLSYLHCGYLLLMEICFEALKNSVGQIFLLLKFLFFLFLYKKSTLSNRIFCSWMCTHWILFIWFVKLICPLEEYFYHWNVHFYYICTKKPDLEQSQFQKMGVASSQFCWFSFCVGYKGKTYDLMKFFGKCEILLFFKYFESLESFELNIELQAIYLRVAP